MVKQIVSSVLHNVFFTYQTTKEVKIPNTFIAVVNRILQLLIFAYIALYIVWWKKGYQQFQEPRGTSVIKIKGIAKVSGNDTERYIRADSGYLWDTAEYQIPPIEENAFFLATRQIFTYNQQEGNCASALDDKLFCNSTSSEACPKDQPTPNRFGYFTGNCIPSPENASREVCEINAWCPEELVNSTEFILNTNDLDDFTIYLKTVVTFGLFNITLRNVRDTTNLTSCRYDKNNDPNCPIFRLGDVLNSFSTNKTALVYQGGLIEIRQDWTCNFDFNPNLCYPKLDFKVLQSGDDVTSPGINYRYAQKFRIADTDYRTLSKVFGLRFIIAISGNGGQFDIVSLFIAIGSGIGFMAIASIVSDAIFMYIHKYREQFGEGKFSVVDINPKRSRSTEDLTHEMLRRRPNEIRTISDIYNEVF